MNTRRIRVKDYNNFIHNSKVNDTKTSKYHQRLMHIISHTKMGKDAYSMRKCRNNKVQKEKQSKKLCKRKAYK